MEEMVEVPLHAIHVNPYQPRRNFDETALDELAGSLKAIGLLHPPVVRRLEAGVFELIAGERRLRAAARAGFTQIPVLVRQADDFQSAQAALLENLQRSDLNPIETALAIRKMMGDFQLTQEELSLRLGKKRSTIANFVRLLTLPQDMQESVGKGQITMGHAKVILSLTRAEDREALHRFLLEREATVREAEAEANRLLRRRQPPTLFSDPDSENALAALKKALENRFGTKAFVEHKRKGGGRIVLHYENLDDLDRLLALMGTSTEG